MLRGNVVGYTQAQVNAARAFDARLARERHKLLPFKGGRLTRQMSLPAYFNMMRDCPPGVSREDRAKYLVENERIYLDYNRERTPVGMANRWGRVKERTVYGADGGKRLLRCA
jgi:hypothetical protein